MQEICDCSTTANENREQNFFKNLSCMREHKVNKHLGPVVQSWVSANPGLKYNPLF